jgi:hypothetical protein
MSRSEFGRENKRQIWIHGLERERNFGGSLVIGIFLRFLITTTTTTIDTATITMIIAMYSRSGLESGVLEGSLEMNMVGTVVCPVKLMV